MNGQIDDIKALAIQVSEEFRNFACNLLGIKM